MQPTGNRGSHGAEQQPNRSGDNASRADEGFLSGVATKVGDAASAVASTAEEAWDSTRQGVQHAASAVAHTAENAWDEFTGLMRRYPFGTLCVGVGIGFLISRLLEGRGTRDLRHLSSDVYDRLRGYASDVASKFNG